MTPPASTASTPDRSTAGPRTSLLPSDGLVAVAIEGGGVHANPGRGAELDGRLVHRHATVVGPEAAMPVDALRRAALDRDAEHVPARVATDDPARAGRQSRRHAAVAEARHHL